MKGLFITFEGPDGSGKSTQIHLLKEHMEAQGLPYILTREPGGTAISDAVRSILLNPEHSELTNETEVLLYAASRAQHVKEKIIPALEKGLTVICDRFVDASVAYQGYGLEIPVESIKQINGFATGGLQPDRTYLVDISPEEGRRRMISRAANEYDVSLDRIEQRQLAYHERVREGFYRIVEEDNTRICVINGNQHPEDVFKDVRADFSQLMNSHKSL